MKTQLRRILIAALIGLLLPASSLWASGFSVAPLVLNFVSGQDQYEDIILNNTGRKGIYVRVIPKRVLNPGVVESDLKFEAYNKKDPYEFGIAVSRQNLYLKPHSVEIIRVVSLQPKVDTDQVYQIELLPHLKGEKIAPRAKSVAARVNVLVGYKVLAFLRPMNGTAKVTFTRQGKHLQFKNSGNTNALLYSGRQCEGDQCTQLPAKRLYAGQQWSLTLPNASSPVYFNEKILNTVNRLTIPAK